jgi:hypothetical protein
MPEPIDRRKFISAAAALAMLGGAGITIGCGSDSGSTPTPPPPPPPTGPKLASIGDNHGHTATILGAQLDAGGAITLNVQGTAPHAHAVGLSATQVATIKAGSKVVVQSTSAEGLLGVHAHTITFN